MIALDDGWLLSKLTQSEDSFVERKASFQEKEVRIALVSFANTIPDGMHGVLFIGAADKGLHHPGVKDADKLQREQIRRLAETKVFPSIKYIPKVLKVEVQGEQREVLAIIIPYSSDKPYSTGLVYVRKGSESIPATLDNFRDLITSENSIIRQLQAYVGKQVRLRVKSSTGFTLNYDSARLHSITSTTISVDNIDGYTWQFDTHDVKILEFGSLPPTIIVPPDWTEDEHIQKIIRQWVNYHPNLKPEEIDKGVPQDAHRFVADQLAANCGRILPFFREEFSRDARPAMTVLYRHVHNAACQRGLA